MENFIFVQYFLKQQLKKTFEPTKEKPNIDVKFINVVQ